MSVIAKACLLISLFMPIGLGLLALPSLRYQRPLNYRAFSAAIGLAAALFIGSIYLEIGHLPSAIWLIISAVGWLFSVLYVYFGLSRRVRRSSCIWLRPRLRRVRLPRQRGPLSDARVGPLDSNFRCWTLVDV